MGYVMDVYIERRDADGRFQSMGETELLSDWGNSPWFAFFADARNHHDIEPIVGPRALPEDASDEVRAAFEALRDDIIGCSWLTVDELLAFDYDAPLRFKENRRDPSLRAETYRQLLGVRIIDDARELKAIGADRVVFWIR